MKKIVLGLVGGSVLIGSAVFAAAPSNRAVNNDIAFDMNIGILNTNTRTKPEDRQTTDPKRAWMVKMTYSSEGDNSNLTRFWLETKNGANRCMGRGNNI